MTDDVDSPELEPEEIPQGADPEPGTPVSPRAERVEQDKRDRVAAAGSTAVLLQADIVEWAQVAAMADEAFKALGQVDALINNVGDVAREQMSWRDITEESIDHVLAVDIKGTMLCIHEFGQRMLEQGHGPS